MEVIKGARKLVRRLHIPLRGASTFELSLFESGHTTVSDSCDLRVLSGALFVLVEERNPQLLEVSSSSPTI